MPPSWGIPDIPNQEETWEQSRKCRRDKGSQTVWECLNITLEELEAVSKTSKHTWPFQWFIHCRMSVMRHTVRWKWRSCYWRKEWPTLNCNFCSSALYSFSCSLPSLIFYLPLTNPLFTWLTFSLFSLSVMPLDPTTAASLPALLFKAAQCLLCASVLQKQPRSPGDTRQTLFKGYWKSLLCGLPVEWGKKCNLKKVWKNFSLHQEQC